MSYDFRFSFKERDISSLELQEIHEIDDHIRKKLQVSDSKTEVDNRLKILSQIALKSPSVDDRYQAQKTIDILKKQMENNTKKRLYKNYILEAGPVIEKIKAYSPVQYYGCSISRECENYSLLVKEKRKFAEIAEKYAQIEFRKVQEVLCDCESETVVEDGFLICKQCGIRETLRQENVGFKDLSRINVAPKSNYDPKNNFDSTILKYQVKNNFPVDASVYDLVKSELALTGIDYKNCSKRDIYEILKRNGLSKVFPGICIIHFKLTGKKPAEIGHLKEKIDALYYKIEKQHTKTSASGKNNSLQVWFKLYKILLFLGVKCKPDDLLFCISEKSLEDYENIWEKILPCLK